MTLGILLFVLFVLWVGLELMIGHALAKMVQGFFHAARAFFRHISARNPKYLKASEDGTKPPPPGPTNS